MAKIMGEDEVTFLLQSWTGIGSQFIGECFDYAKPYIDKDFNEIDPYLRFVNAQLFIDCHLTSESVLILVRNGKEWDADLMLRSVIEGSLKYLYMTNGTQQDMLEKAQEYWEKLPSLAAVPRSIRAKRLLESVPNPDAPEWRPFIDLILDDEEIRSRHQNFTKAQRKTMEERWSFTGIIKHFVEADQEPLKGVIDLAHSYAMSSHLLHKDGDGVGMVWDRYKREPERHQAAKMSHSARIVSDTCDYARVRLLFLLKACAKDERIFLEIGNKYGSFLKILKESYKDFIDVEYRAT